MESASFLSFVHSLLRYAVVLSVAGGAFLALRGRIMQRPILIGERSVFITAVVLCHVQLAIGLILYFTRFKAFGKMAGVHMRFWKYEHITTMIVAVLLVTIGRALAKRAKSEPRKQMLIGVLYLLALLLMLWAIPWPFTEFGRDLGWI